jgi:hypothetical protein
MTIVRWQGALGQLMPPFTRWQGGVGWVMINELAASIFDIGQFDVGRELNVMESYLTPFTTVHI